MHFSTPIGPPQNFNNAVTKKTLRNGQTPKKHTFLMNTCANKDKKPLVENEAIRRFEWRGKGRTLDSLEKDATGQNIDKIQK